MLKLIGNWIPENKLVSKYGCKNKEAMQQIIGLKIQKRTLRAKEEMGRRKVNPRKEYLGLELQMTTPQEIQASPPEKTPV